MTVEKAEKLLRSIKPSVCDHFKISALHFLNGGPSAIKHFQLLMNLVIQNISNSNSEALNTAHAIVLFKGHSKSKSNASSYRTISSCTILAKCLDVYVKELSSSEWLDAQPETQYLGKGLNHEMCALLLTETIHHSLSVLNEPLFCLFVDA